jgi:hypothetical protein
MIGQSEHATLDMLEEIRNTRKREARFVVGA